MSSNETHATRRATRWIRFLATVVTGGLLATVGVHLGAYGQRVAAGLSVRFDRSPFAGAPESISIAAGLLHDASMVVGILALVGSGWLALVLLVRVCFVFRAST